jgi:hypothetical protein
MNMIAFKRLLEATRSLITSPLALAIFAALYALLLVSLYGFISIREATVWQVLVTMFFVVLIPLEFFVLQAAILQHSRAGKFQWAQLIRDAIKLAVVTIPIILLGYLLAYLLNKWQLRYPVPTAASLPVTPNKAPPLHWPTLLFGTLKFLLLGLVLPLGTIHLWIAATASDVRTSLSGGAKSVLQRIGNAFARALAFDSVLIYAIGLIVFVLIPYAILFVPFKMAGTKSDFAVLIARLLLVFIFTLTGWVLTLSALARTAAEASPAVTADTVPETPAEAPA